MPANSKTLIGAIIAAVLAVAVYYGLLSKQSADNMQNQANQTLGTGAAPQQAPAPQPPASPAPQPTTQAPSSTTPAPQTAPSSTNP